MNLLKNLPGFLPLFLALTCVGETSHEWCAAHLRAPAAGSPAVPLRQFAPDRHADFLHLKLDVTPDFNKRTVQGKASLMFQPIAQPLTLLRLDAVDLRIRSITSPGRPLTFSVQEEAILISFAQPVKPTEKAEVTIDYSAQPTQGLYFRTPEMGYRKTDGHLFTQGETDESRHWFPSFDYPNEKFTSEVIARIPQDMIALSNGKLISDSIDESSGLRITHWSQEQPHVNYLVTLVAGKFEKIEDKHGDVPLAFFVPPSEKDQAAASFKDTRDMMVFFEKEIGVPYPWAKYYQVCVNDFHFGGMENTTLTVLTDRTLFVREWENLKSSQGLVAHELAHQWFGDLVTCKDWSHIWLNEGFATYYTHLYDAHKNGRDSMLYELYMDAAGFLDTPNDIQPIVFRTYQDPNQQFGFHAYPKGSWVLHMLRHQLGEELFRTVIRTYLERHRFQTVVTEDLNRIVEEFSGRSFDRFFDQWVYHAHHPELNISYAWDPRTKLARISVQQVQKLSETVLMFQVPLTVRFKTDEGTFDRVLEVKNKAEDFYVSLPSEPKLVRIDPDYALLAKIKFRPPAAMLQLQVQDEKDVIGRILAVEALAADRTHESVQLLGDRLKKDPFYGVRVEASKALRGSQTPEALKILIASRSSQSDARVRNQVTQDIASYYTEDSRQALAEIARSEKNPMIRAEAVQSLSLYPGADQKSLLADLLSQSSYRHVLGDAAIQAMRRQKNPVYLNSLLAHLIKSEDQLNTGQFSRAFDALAYLARDEAEQKEVLSYLLKQVGSPRAGIRLGAMAALGTLENDQALPVLQKISASSKIAAEKSTAEAAVKKIQSRERPFDQLQQLRQEVLELQKTNRQLREEMEQLKKKTEAAPAKSPGPAVENRSRKR